MDRVRVLILEDRPADAELMVAELRRAGLAFDWQRVDSEREFQTKLDSPPDLILADFNMPQFTAMRALQILKERGLDIPFIIASGSIGEDVAVSALQEGAADYLLKDRLTRLGAAAVKALEAKRLRDHERLAEQALRDSEQRYRSLFEGVPVGLYRSTPDGRLLDANPALVQMLGYPDRETLLAVRAIDLYVDPSEREKWREQLNRQGIVEQFQLRLRRRDGRIIWARNTARAVRDDAGRAQHYEGTIEDITESKEAENLLARERNLLRTLIDSVPDYINVKDLESRYVVVNQAYARFLGKQQPDELIGKTVFDVFPRHLAAQYVADDQTVLRSGAPLIVESATVDREHRSRWHAVTKVPLRNSSGETVGLVGVSRDITERKEAEERIQAQLQALTSLYASAHRLSQSLNLADLIEYAASTAVKVFGAGMAWVGRADPDGSVTLLGRYPVEPDLLGQIAVRWDDAPGGRGPTGQAIRTGFPKVLPDLTADTAIPAGRRAELIAKGFKCAAALPLISRDKPFGVLTLYTEDSGFFTPARVEFLQAFANLVAAALENARLFEESDQRVRQFAALHETSLQIAAEEDLSSLFATIGRHATDLIGADGCTIGLYDAARRDVEVVHATDARFRTSARIPLGVGMLGRVVETKAPVIIDDYPTWPHRLPDTTPVPIGAGLGIPITYAGELTGVISVYASNGHKHRFSAEDARLLTLFATQAAVAIYRTQLLAELRRRVEQLQTLRDIDTAITGSLDIRVTLGVLLDKVTTSLGVDAADILLFNPHSQVLEYGAGRGFRTSALQKTRLPLGAGYAGRAALERTAMSVPDLREAPREFARSPLIQGEGFVAYHAVPLVAKGQIKGVLEVFHRAPLSPQGDWAEFLAALAGQAAIALDNATLLMDLQQANTELMVAYDTTLEGWSRALDLRDRETEGHTQRVTEITLRLGRAMDVRDEELVHIRRGALLHDIGKMGIPDSILLKPGPLTEEEWVIMRRHPAVASDLLSQIPYLRAALDIPRYHHEKWDGSGYPQGLKGADIPLAARIFAVVDVWDALTSDRPYRTAWPAEKARAYLREQAGKHFDPRIVDAFLALISQTPG